MTRLYDIAEDLYSVINGGMVFNEETGEIIFDSENLDQLEAEFNDKLEACGVYVKNLKADVEALKAERTRLSERIRVAENKIERMKSYIFDCMARTEMKKLSTSKIEIGTRKSYAVSIDDEKAIPSAFIKTEIVENFDKKAIMDALKKGVTIEGASLEERNNITIK